MRCKLLLETIFKNDKGDIEYANRQTRLGKHDPMASTPFVADEINTDFRHALVKWKPEPDIRWHARTVRTMFGDAKVRILTVFKRPEGLDWLDKVKSGGVIGHEKMLEDAANYAASAFERTHFDLVVSVPSSKPLAAEFANKVASKIGVDYSPIPVNKIGTAKSSHVSVRGGESKFQWKDTGIGFNGLDVLVIDDLTTSDSSLTEIATMILDKKARSVTALALIGKSEKSKGRVESLASKLVRELIEGDSDPGYDEPIIWKVWTVWGDKHAICYVDASGKEDAIIKGARILGKNLDGNYPVINSRIKSLNTVKKLRREESPKDYEVGRKEVEARNDRNKPEKGQFAKTQKQMELIPRK